ncbi:MAG: hypothetical protein IH594_08605 [Bacteroidales bacterium]|nr:hypothetical protein [Bacteroidales bacterium]
MSLNVKNRFNIFIFLATDKLKNSLKNKFARLCVIVIVLIAIPVVLFAETVGVFYDSNVAQIKFAATDVKAAVESKHYTVEILPLTSLIKSYANIKVVIALASDKTALKWRGVERIY